MFVICGKGGKGDENSFLTAPWRIVSPALVFFVIMTILSLINLIIVENGLSQFCDSFNENFNSLGCTLSINRFMTAPVEDYSIVPPGAIRIVLSTFNYIAFFSWLSSALLLIARIIFVVDFQLVRVTVKSVEYENSENSSFKVVQVEEEQPDSNGNEATSQC